MAAADSAARSDSNVEPTSGSASRSRRTSGATASGTAKTATATAGATQPATRTRKTATAAAPKTGPKRTATKKAAPKKTEGADEVETAEGEVDIEEADLADEGTVDIEADLVAAAQEVDADEADDEDDDEETNTGKNRIAPTTRSSQQKSADFCCEDRVVGAIRFLPVLVSSSSSSSSASSASTSWAAATRSASMSTVPSSARSASSISTSPSAVSTSSAPSVFFGAAFLVAVRFGPVFGAAAVAVLRVRVAGCVAPAVAVAVFAVPDAVAPDVRRLRDAEPDVGSTFESLRAAESAAATWALSLRALESLRRSESGASVGGDGVAVRPDVLSWHRLGRRRRWWSPRVPEAGYAFYCNGAPPRGRTSRRPARPGPRMHGRMGL